MINHPPGTTAMSAGGDRAEASRNRFFRGKQMKAEDFEREQHYFIGRRRQINRAVLGWGVVQGLPVTSQTSPATIRVGAGLALDRHGREIDVGQPVALDAGNTFVIKTGSGGCDPRSIEKLEKGLYLLSIHYAERRFGDAGLPGSCGGAGTEKKYVGETAVFSLESIHECPCPEKECHRECTCGDVSACGESGRGPHACLCQWVEQADVAGEGSICEWCPPGRSPFRAGYWIDPSAGVPLACVRAGVEGEDNCPVLVGEVIDGCSPRRLVKSNDLLYDLIRGCDLTHIEWISWASWYTYPKVEVPWDEFAKMFRNQGTTEFIVKFSNPVRTATLQRNVVTLSAITLERGTGWGLVRRVPLGDLDTTPDLTGGLTLPTNTTNQMRLTVMRDWLSDEVAETRLSWLHDDFTFEIEIHGDLILDCHGQAVDANAVGQNPPPTGNRTPGGTFRSSFRIVHPQPGYHAA